jgi:DNA polymerase III subunit delta'
VNDETIQEADRLEGAPHPREHGILVGHAEAEASVLRAWQSGRLPHAFLIGGPEGIGKATLAYRIARFVLAHPVPDQKPRQDLSIAEDHPVSRQVAALSHPDLLVLRRVLNEEGTKFRSDIRVDDVRRIVSFFGSTPAFGGYRVCVVDSIEEMNASGLNALLKLVEEPPAKSIFLLISHAPGRVMATIRSRCQRMRLNPLSTEEVARAVTALAARMPELPRAQIPDAAAASGGSVRRALELLLGEGLEVRSLSTEMLERLPSVDPAQLHTLGDRMQGEQGLAVFTETIEDWLASQATRENQPPARLARYAETWEKVRRAAIETDVFRLDRKPFVFQIFAMLADASRR